MKHYATQCRGVTLIFQTLLHTIEREDRNEDADGRYGAYEEIGMHVTAADLNMDGVQEVILGNTLVDPSGNTLCQATGLEDGYTASADVNGDGQGEVIVVGNGRVGVYDSTCGVVDTWSLAGGGTGGPPTVSDFDADGEVEIGIADADTYTVYERDGQVLWSHPVSDASSHATGSPASLTATARRLLPLFLPFPRFIFCWLSN